MLGISSCDKAPINGKLDGRWQLMTIEYTNGKIEECNRIYYSIQLHLVEISAKGGNGGTHIGRFSYKGDEVTMSEFRHRGDEEKLTTLNELKPFGLNQAINHLKVEKATGKKLILKSDYARLTFRKLLKKYTTGYTNCLPIKYRQNNLYAIAVANHYTGFLEINLSAEIKLVPPLMEPALQILKPAS